jgi:hypothetical protein
METVTPDESRLDEEQEPAAPDEATPPGEAPPMPSEDEPPENPAEGGEEAPTG